ncbi:MAG: HAMP domain-containing sensor histidine kinase [Propionibacteriales bacterium]|nr:HAMP domain-containing sensor histidine kinase [Propionibacteriales bacterium]
MSLEDLTSIVVTAAIAALVVGALGLVAGRVLRYRSIRWQLVLIALVPVASAYAGATAVAQMMFISAHDLLVMSVVTTVAAVVGFAMAVIVAAVISRWSAALHAQVRAFEDDPTVEGDRARSRPGTAELRSLAAELSDARRRLRESADRERRLEEARRELVSWVSHDLRTPLAGLRAMVEALEDDMVTDPSRYHRQIRTEVDWMTVMVDDLFELARIHAGVLSVVPEQVLLADLVSEALAGADAVARVRDVRVTGSVEEGIEVVVDPGGIARVLANLLSNAVRHTRPGGEVTVRGRLRADTVEIEVVDECGGIAPEDMARVFDVAWQAAPARTPDASDIGGAGLGLAIVKGVVEAHTGEVVVVNRGDGHGCVFRVTLPVTGADQDTETVRPEAVLR